MPILSVSDKEKGTVSFRLWYGTALKQTRVSISSIHETVDFVLPLNQITEWLETENVSLA
jgi:hypothetical protein